MKKISASGHYLRFPGITVVAGIRQVDEKIWQQVFQLLTRSDLIKKHYSPLPLTSYHVTTLNLCVESDFEPGEWLPYLRNACIHVYQPMFNYLEEHRFNPQIQFEHIHTRGALQLVFSMPHEQQDIILSTAKHYGLIHNVPPAFHMTLAYQYREIASDDLSQLENYLHQGLHQIFKQADSKLILNPPRLSYFLDMTAFHPWDGTMLTF